MEYSLIGAVHRECGLCCGWNVQIQRHEVSLREHISADNNREKKLQTRTLSEFTECCDSFKNSAMKSLFTCRKINIAAAAEQTIECPHENKNFKCNSNGIVGNWIFLLLSLCYPLFRFVSIFLLFTRFATEKSTWKCNKWHKKQQYTRWAESSQLHFLFNI